jgi:hypothetical protein
LYKKVKQSKGAKKKEELAVRRRTVGCACSLSSLSSSLSVARPQQDGVRQANFGSQRARLGHRPLDLLMFVAELAAKERRTPFGGCYVFDVRLCGIQELGLEKGV